MKRPDCKPYKRARHIRQMKENLRKMSTIRINPPLMARLLALAVFILSGATPLKAQQISSLYTKLDLDECTLITNADLGLPEPVEEELGMGDARFACVGYNNSLVYVTEGDLRMFVSFGLGAMQEKAAEQTLPAFNTIGDTLEWRVAYKNGQWVPFATILRWKTQIGDGSQPDGQILVVTKLEPGNVCHVAYINATLIANANEEARRFADNQVPGFDCSRDRITYVPGE